MSRHPLDPAPHPLDSAGSSPRLPPVRDDDIRRFSMPDMVIRATSPLGRRYLKPINGIQTKGFARSAQRRSSVVTLGSIERLQHYYARLDLKVNKTGMLGFRSTTTVVEDPAEEEADEQDDLRQLRDPPPPPPSWADLDVETDLDVLLDQCFEEIQHMLQTWAIVAGPQEDTELDGLPILPLLQSVTRMIHAVKNYTMQRHDLSDAAQHELRQATLRLLEAIQHLENAYRVDEGDGKGEEGYIYRNSDFQRLDKERQAIREYLTAVETYGFHPPHHIGSPRAVFTPEIKALMVKASIMSPNDTESSQCDLTAASTPPASSIPDWLDKNTFPEDPMGRYHAMLKEYGKDWLEASAITIPNPRQDETEFLNFLADGILLCHVYNNVVKRSRRPFGFISKIHEDTRRTYRAIENLRHFTASCKFRFEIVFGPHDLSEMARKTDKGLDMIKHVLTAFCECVIKESRESVVKASNRRSLPPFPPIGPDIAAYMENKLFISRNDGKSTKMEDKRS